MGNGQTSWDDKTSPAVIEEAFKRKDHATVGQVLNSLCANLDDTRRGIDAEIAKKVLASLRNYAWFEKLNQMAEKFDQYAQDDPGVLCALAQARIELGHITRAIEGLLKLASSLEDQLAGSGQDPIRKKTLEREMGEALGMLGRAYKQYYVNAQPSRDEPRDYDLTKSLEYYGKAYNAGLGDYLWHGINYVALLAHRERTTSGRRYSTDAGAIARTILKVIDDMANDGPLRPWDFANCIEAHLAIGETPEAVAATEKYLECQGTSAFNVQSTRRQLIEIWGLIESEPPGDQILPMMTARLAELGGTTEHVELDPAKAANYEKVWGETKYRPLRWLQEALERSKCVARIGSSKYDGDGTGFLFDGQWIGDEWAGKI
jgi:hypothetical protein